MRLAVSPDFFLRQIAPKQRTKTDRNISYPPVNEHGNGNSPFPIGNTSSNGGFSIAMLVYRRVPEVKICIVETSNGWNSIFKLCFKMEDV